MSSQSAVVTVSQILQIGGQGKSRDDRTTNTRGEAWTEVLVDLMYISIMCWNNNSRHVDAEQISGSWFGLCRNVVWIWI